MRTTATLLLVAASMAAQPSPYSITSHPAKGGDALAGLPIGAINAADVPDALRAKLLASLPVHQGDLYSADAWRRTVLAAKAVDPHLIVRTGLLDLPGGGGREALLEIAEPGPASAEPPAIIELNDTVMAANVTWKVTPAMPDAKASGVVRLSVTVGTDGTVKSVRSLQGPPALIRPAVQAVAQWKYRPTEVNGWPVQVETFVDVLFPAK